MLGHRERVNDQEVCPINNNMSACYVPCIMPALLGMRVIPRGRAIHLRWKRKTAGMSAHTADAMDLSVTLAQATMFTRDIDVFT